MAGSLLPQPKQLFQDANWNPLIGGRIYTYAAGTLTPKTTYQDAALTIANTNPTLANARGEALMFGTGAYRFILKDPNGNTIYDVDDVESARSIADSLISALLASLSSMLGSSFIGWIQLGAGAIRRTVLARLRDGHVTPEDFGAVGDGVADDYDAISAAILTGRNVQFTGGKTYRVTKTLKMNIATLAAQKYQSQTLYLAGASFALDPGDASNASFLSIIGWPFVPGTRMIVQGGGARISTTRADFGGDAVAFVEGYGNHVFDIEGRGFSSVVHLYIGVADRWCEAMVVDRVRGLDITYGVRSSIIGGRTQDSFDNTHINNCEFNLERNGAVAYNLDGFHGRSTLNGCGAFPNEAGATGCVAFRFNGTFSNATMIGCWADGGATADNTIQFGPAYTCLDESNSSMAGAITVIGTGVIGDTANYLKLPPGWQFKMKVIDSANVYGSNLWSDELGGTGVYRNAAPGAILQFSGQFSVARGTTNTLYKKTVALPSGVRRIQHAVVGSYANGIDSQALSAGQCGLFSVAYVASKPVSVTFFCIPTNVNGTSGGEGCAYMFDISLQME